MPRQTSKGRSAHTKIAIPKTRRPEETARQKSCMQRPRNPASNTGPSTRQPPRRKEKKEKSTHTKITKKERKVRSQDGNISKRGKAPTKSKNNSQHLETWTGVVAMKNGTGQKGKRIWTGQNEPKEGTDAQPNAISRKALKEIQTKHRKIVMDRKRSRMAICEFFVRLRKFCQTASLHLNNNHRGARAQDRWRQCKKAIRECSDAHSKGVRDWNTAS